MSVRRSMRLASAMAFASAVSATADVAPAALLATQRIRVSVAAPPGTSDDAIYLTGSLPDVGNWRPDAVRLTRQPDGRYAGDVRLRLGARVEFKLTRRGDWASVETRADGAERENRFLAVEATTTDVQLSVERWAA